MWTWKQGRGKPVIGIAGGIGAGKSSISGLFAGEGCAVIDADRLSHEILQTAEVKEELRRWLGPGVFDADGAVNRKALAREVFGDPERTVRLNELIHPRVAQRRAQLMAQYLTDSAIRAVIWDTPLLFEAGLNEECDVVVFVDVGRNTRLERLAAQRGWGPEELERREKLQIPLDKKASIADYCIDNSGDEVSSLHQVQRVLSQLFASRTQ